MAECSNSLLSSESIYYDEDTAKKETITIATGNHNLSLSLLSTLGQGAFGIVYKAKDDRGKFFAVKKINCVDEAAYYTIAQEIQILMNLNHDNIVRMRAFDFINSSAILVMDFCELGTLNTKLREVIDEETKIKWFAQLAAGLNYLHENHIIHRDLKCDNVLVCEENILKITDFGVSRQFICAHGKHFDANPDTYLSEYLHSYIGTFAGTPFWVAPEVFDLKYNEAADIFSLGAIFYAILEQKYTTFQGTRFFGLFDKYHNEDVGIGLIMFETKQQVVPRYTKEHRSHVKEIINAMVEMDAAKRPGIVAVYDTVNKINADFLLNPPEIAPEEEQDYDEVDDEVDAGYEEATVFETVFDYLGRLTYACPMY